MDLKIFSAFAAASLLSRVILLTEKIGQVLCFRKVFAVGGNFLFIYIYILPPDSPIAKDQFLDVELRFSLQFGVCLKKKNL